MTMDEKYMDYCIQLAKKGLNNVSPNPMVGCVIVHNKKIIGKGFHEHYGGPHAEVNAINNVTDSTLLKESILYVNLEPCSHYGKTPPCADLIIKNNIPKVVIGCKDSFSEVSGKGIKKLQEAKIEVIVGTLEKKAVELNQYFFTYHLKKRPYIILKWAQTQDGFIDIDRKNTEHIKHLKKEAEKKNNEPYNWITNADSKKLAHQWRSEVKAIMIGTNTAVNDNPQLTVREVRGNNPLRIVLDLTLRLPNELNVFDNNAPTIVFNYLKSEKNKNLEYIQLNKGSDIINEILGILYERKIQSLIIEGGTQLLQTFIDANLWDEIRIFIGNKLFKKGLAAPLLKKKPHQSLSLGRDHLYIYQND